MPIPHGISREDVLRALDSFDHGIRNDFGPPTIYEVFHDGRRYPPKAAIGLAATRLLGRPLTHNEFSGGKASDQANSRLLALGFLIVPRGALTGDAKWLVRPGDRIRRQDLQTAYGGAPRGGIEPSARTLNVFVFSEPEKAATHSYGFDGWAAPDVFHYTGEGRTGDQLFTHGNRAILEHATQGRRLRLFRAKPPWATYLGEFGADSGEPFRLADSPGVDGLLRQVIVFRLRPRGRFVDAGLGSAPDVPVPGVSSVPAGTPQSEALPVAAEQSHTDAFVVQPSGEPIEFIRREASLVGRYRDWLAARGHTSGRHRVAIKHELTVLLTDLYDETDRELIEAKASASRASVRSGLGQLLDYARYVEHNSRALLLPSEPRADLIDLLGKYGCACIWETRPGEFARRDPCSLRSTQFVMRAALP